MKKTDFRLKFLKEVYLNENVYKLDDINLIVEWCGLVEENQIIEKENFQADKPIDKCGPNLRCSANGVKAIACAGFKCPTLANNHIRDYGDSAVKRTIKTLDDLGLDYVGAGSNNEEAAKVLYKNISCI